MADDDRTALFDAIETDLAGVEQALARLDAGTYFTCEVCATPIDPVAGGNVTAVRCAACVPSAPIASSASTEPEQSTDAAEASSADEASSAGEPGAGATPN